MDWFSGGSGSQYQFRLAGREAGWRVVALQGEEGLSLPFHYQLELASENPAEDLPALLGQQASVHFLDPAGAELRCVHGLIAAAEQGASGRIYTRYRLRLVSWLHLLSLRSDCRLFQDMDVAQIVSAVFDGAGISRNSYQLHLQQSYEKRATCVQYQETDFDFVARLLRQAGIFYFFEHGRDGQVLMLGDSAVVHGRLPYRDRLRYTPAVGRTDGADAGIFPFSRACRLCPDSVLLRDYNFLRPRLNQEVSEGAAAEGRTPLRIYDYPGNYRLPEEGTRLAQLRLRQWQVDSESFRGGSKCRWLAAGYRFSLAGHPRADTNGDYVISELRLMATQPQALEADAAVAAADFNVEFVCLPAERRYVPPCAALPPRMPGPQTAVVTGPAGEEVYTDEYGRVKVKFHWDRGPHQDERSSAWVRVAQLTAGARWGSMFLPRVGQEVVVEFEGGDPDRPLITGTLYHARNKPPYPLPEFRARSTWRGHCPDDAEEANEISFDDSKAEQHFIVRAQRDYSRRVGNDTREYVGRNRHLRVKQDQLEAVDGDKHQTVKGDQVLVVDGALSLRLGADAQLRIADELALATGADMHLRAGGQCVIEATRELTLRVGGSFVKIDAAGITLQGALVRINCGGSPGQGAGVNPDDARMPDEALAPAAGETPPAQAGGAGTDTAAVATDDSPQAGLLRQAARDGTPLLGRCTDVNGGAPHD